MCFKSIAENGSQEEEMKCRIQDIRWKENQSTIQSFYLVRNSYFFMTDYVSCSQPIMLWYQFWVIFSSVCLQLKPVHYNYNPVNSLQSSLWPPARTLRRTPGLMMTSTLRGPGPRDSPKESSLTKNLCPRKEQLKAPAENSQGEV